MSFSQNIKKELSFQISNGRHCMLAELGAIISYNGKIITKNKKNYLIIRTENLEVARKYFTLLKKTFNISINLIVRKNNNQKKTNIYILMVNNNDIVSKILLGTKLIEDKQSNIIQKNPNKILIQNTCCKRAFVRGAFLSSGSISNPNKAYHLEIVSVDLDKVKYLKEILDTFNIDGKIIKRKKYYILYIKDASQIVDFLNIIEAHVALMELENVRILKEVRNNVNRQVNCETANINRTVLAASKQIEDIKYIREKLGYTGLPTELVEIADLRIENPSLSLNELGLLLTPNLSRSGVNHRLKRLGVIAKELRDKEEL